MTMTIAAGRDRGLGAIALEWWDQNCSPSRGSPGTRARLRRCRSSLEALGIPAAVSLARRLGAMAEQAHPGRLEAALGLARVLAHVNGNAKAPVMRVVGWKSFPEDRGDGGDDPGNRPRLSEARFRRLLQAVPGEDLPLMMIRLVHLAGEPINIAGLAQDYLTWYRDATRYRWAFQYFAAGAAAPDTSDTDGEDTA